jgi:signal transduction histidine kinase
MSKSLLQRNARYLLTWLPVVLFICCCAFYLLLHMQAHHMQEKQLLLKQHNVWAEFVNNKRQLEKHIVGEYDIIEAEKKILNNDSELRDTSIYYADKQKSLPFEKLTGNFTWNTKNYLVTTYVSSTEISHLIIKVFIAEIVILLLLLLAIVLLNRKSARFLWKPFFISVDALQQYDIKENQSVVLQADTGTSEFDQLNKTVTGLISNSNAAWQQQKQFVENASHEIQTPLAIIRSKLELLISEPNLTERQASLLSDITDANERLSQMNRTLLLLAKIENNQFPGVEQINISLLIVQVIETYKKHYENFPRLLTNIEDNTIVPANRSLIEILVTNLVKNAIIHQSAGGRISISLIGLRLVIENPGSPSDIAPSELFDRFKKGSHNLKTTGLGLAIVKQICNLYQYAVSYDYENGLHRVTVNFNKND